MWIKQAISYACIVLVQDVTDLTEKSVELRIKEIAITNATSPFVFTDLDGRITDVNDACLNMWGYDNKAELIGMNNSKLSSTTEEISEIMEKLLQNGSWSGEGEAIKKDGSVFNIFLSTKVIYDKNGKAISLFGSFIDITVLKKNEALLKEREREILAYSNELERKVAERTLELEDSKARLLVAQEIAKVGYWEWDLEANSLNWSAQLYKNFGLDNNSPIALDEVFKYTHPEDTAYLKDATAKARETGMPQPVNYRIITPKGEIRHMYGLGERKVVDNAGNIKKLRGIIQDVTDLKKAEETLRKSEVKLKEALQKEKELNELKSRFVSMASHEFRTPLSSILSSAGLIKIYKEKGILEKQEKHINRIKSSVRNLTTILNDFLSIEKLESGKVDYVPQEVEFCQYIKEVITEVKPWAQEHQQIIHQHMGPSQVQIDAHLVRNILLNLLSNALKYSPDDKAVEIISENQGKQMKIKIIDQGIGIPLKDQKNMFSRFFRATNVTNIKGTGIGLTIVKRYLDIMNGSIDFVSKEGEGSTFTVVIPQ